MMSALDENEDQYVVKKSNKRKKSNKKHHNHHNHSKHTKFLMKNSNKANQNA